MIGSHTPNYLKRIIKEKRKEGSTIAEIARSTGSSARMVREILINEGLMEKRTKGHNPDAMAEVRELANDGMKIYKIAMVMHMGHHTVEKILEEEEK